jgi:hypothetical protein
MTIVTNQIAHEHVDYVIIERNGAVKPGHEAIIGTIPLNGQYFRRLEPPPLSTNIAHPF